MKTEYTRRDFLAKSTLAGMAALTVPFSACAGNETLFYEPAVGLYSGGTSL